MYFKGRLQGLRCSIKRNSRIVEFGDLRQRCFWYAFSVHPGFPGGSDGKESACSAGDPGSVPGSGRSPGEGNGYPLQYSCLEIPMDRGAWQTTVHGFEKSQT